jgi:cobalt/nickel transport system permease protein
VLEPLPAGGLLSRVDPRLLLPPTVIGALALALCPSLDAAALGLALVSLLMLFAGPPLPALLKRLKPALLFLCCAALLLPLTVPGPALWSWGPFAVSETGLKQGALWLCRGLGAVMLLVGTLGPIPHGALARSAAWWRCPSSLISLALLTLRFAGTIAQEQAAVRQAAALRGWQLRAQATSLRHLGWMVGGSLIRAEQRAQRLSQAMTLRGFDGRYPRETRPLAPAGLAACVVLSCVIIALGGLPWLNF